MAEEEVQEQQVQRKLIDMFFRCLSASMIPIGFWAYSLSLDIALIKDDISDFKEDLVKIEESIEKNSSFIKETNVKVQKIDTLKQAQDQIQKDLESVEATLSIIYQKVLTMVRN